MRISFMSLTLALIASSATAATYTVEPDGTGDFPTIQAAIDAAQDGDVVELGDGVYRGAGNRDITLLGKAITVRSQSGDPDDCIIDCEGTAANRRRGFRIDAGEGPGTVISGITIINGWAPLDNPGDWGGGILCLFASPTLENCVVRQSDAGWGGGILLWGSSSRVLNCWVSENAASMNGGGIYITTGGDPIVEGLTVVNNRTAGSGGAFACNASSPQIKNCTVLGNESLSGAVWVINGASPTIDNSIVAGNFPGPAFHCASSVAILSCCDIFGNGGGDWVSCIGDQLGIRGNIALDPMFCSDYDGTRFSMHLQEGSPCAPHTPPNQQCDLIGAHPAGCLSPSAADEAPSDQLGLSAQVMPNPMTDRTEILLTLPHAAWVSAAVLDAAGRVVRHLLNEYLPSGMHRVAWDANSNHGARVPAGVYFVTMRSGGATTTRQIVMVN